ncbi:MAG: WG repeat-containing protein [Lachnospiraceae bacterium]|nr:WG repeat-containing protein [Lachnospiraceae bacterium]
MKGKKLILFATLLVVLAVGWILSVRMASGKDIVKQQEELVEQADVFASKGLYVRAIPLYEEALTLQTNQNERIEEKVLAAYRNYGDADSYLDLVNTRAEANRATEEEYLLGAQYYINSWSLNNAMTLIKLGIEQLGTESLIEFYEENRYGYSLKITNYDEIIPTLDNEMMPVLDGEYWGYIDSMGMVQLSCAYDFATSFNSSGYAVVSVDGTYYTILENGDRYGLDEVGVEAVYGLTDKYILAKVNESYSYYDYDFNCRAENHQYEDITVNACGVAAVKKDGKWGIITDSGQTVTDFIYDDVAVNSLGEAFCSQLAMVKQGGVWYLIDTEGNRVCENSFFDAKAPESSGYIAVANGDGDWGYIDQTGTLVIDYQYEDALSFSNHLGAVCILGDWAYISESNVVVIDEILEDAQPFHNGIAQALFADGEALITLSYFEE